MSKIIEIVRDNLDMRDATPAILDKVPLLVKLAVVDLQTNKKILPPKILRFAAGDLKEELRDTDNEVFYNFFYLPEDFVEMDSIFVYDSKSADDKTYPYTRQKYDQYLNQFDTDTKQKFFSITDREDGNNTQRKIIAMNPYPSDSTMIEVKYFVDGSDDNYDWIKPQHWKSIIRHCEAQVGIRPQEDADEAADEQVSNWRNQDGKDPLNSPRKTKPSYFGNTSRSYTQKNRLR